MPVENVAITIASIPTTKLYQQKPLTQSIHDEKTIGITGFEDF